MVKDSMCSQSDTKCYNLNKKQTNKKTKKIMHGTVANRCMKAAEDGQAPA